MKKRRRPAATIADIGRELGISAMTVSRALNGSPDVNEETRRRVLTHAERLNYRPNRWARSLVTQKSRIIGIIVPDISHSYFSEITRAVQLTLEPHGYDLMLCHTHGDPARESAAVEMLLGSRVDGLIVASQRPENDPGIYAEMQRDGTPFVLLDRFFPSLECSRVRTDDVLVGRIATAHLLDLGHRRIAHIRGPEVSVGRLRLEGYVQTMNEAGIEVPDEWIASGAFQIVDGYEAMQRLLALPQRPTAVFATNDPAGIGAIRACRDSGLRVPEDVSIVGAGTVEGPLYPNPFLTTVDWSRQTLGESAALMLLDSIRNDASRTGREFHEKIAEPGLLIRQSTAPPVSEGLIQCASVSLHC
jgi:LacI family transcriptional regulator